MSHFSDESVIFLPLAIGHWLFGSQQVNESTSSHPDEKAIADDYFVCCAQSIEEKQKKTGKTKENIFGVCVAFAFALSFAFPLVDSQKANG